MHLELKHKAALLWVILVTDGLEEETSECEVSYRQLVPTNEALVTIKPFVHRMKKLWQSIFNEIFECRILGLLTISKEALGKVFVYVRNCIEGRIYYPAFHWLRRRRVVAILSAKGTQDRV